MRFTWRINAIFLLAFILPFQITKAAAPLSGTRLSDGKSVELAAGKKGSVLVFLSTKCPCSNSHLPMLKQLAAEYKDFSFWAVHSNADEPLSQTSAYFKEAALPFPVIQDADGKLADEFKALKTPHAFLLSPEGKILYRGGVTSSANAAEAKKHYLHDALAEVERGAAVSVENARTLGCVIAR